MVKWIAAEKVRDGLRYAILIVLAKVTGGIKDRISQTKHAHADSLAIVN